MFKIRKSKYRHIFNDPPKPEECFAGFRLSTATGEQQYIKASAKYFAVSLYGGGGPVGVGRLDRPGRFESQTSSIVAGHSGCVLDCEFSPFDDSLLATASEDTTIKLWNIPDDWEPTDEKGNCKEGENLSESLTDLTGHAKKVTLLRYHPTASNVLLSTSGDCTVKVWDVEKGEALNTFAESDTLTHDIVWDTRGDSYAMSSKDKIVRLVDARTGSVTNTMSAHDGAKSVKLSFLGESGKFLTTGASKQAGREMKIWDLKNLSTPLATEKVDTGSGALLPLYDDDTRVLYLCGKGDGIVRLYEFDDQEPFIHKLNNGIRSTPSAKGLCLVPKRGLDVMKCETARLLKVTNTQGIFPLTMTVPRKSDAFQDDIFPDCPSLVPAHSAEQWMNGSSKPPNTMPLNPALQNVSHVKKSTFKTVSQLSKELSEAQQRIKYLEGLLEENSIQFNRVEKGSESSTNQIDSSDEKANNEVEGEASEAAVENTSTKEEEQKEMEATEDEEVKDEKKEAGKNEEARIEAEVQTTRVKAAEAAEEEEPVDETPEKTNDTVAEVEVEEEKKEEESSEQPRTSDENKLPEKEEETDVASGKETIKKTDEEIDAIGEPSSCTDDENPVDAGKEEAEESASVEEQSTVVNDITCSVKELADSVTEETKSPKLVIEPQSKTEEVQGSASPTEAIEISVETE